MPGKTEICFESICGYLAQGKKVGFAISRRQVVLEIANRLRIAFPELSVCEVLKDIPKLQMQTLLYVLHTSCIVIHMPLIY
ncbi:MAG: hypothetical protein U0O16_05000 [Holdemanella sp.]